MLAVGFLFFEAGLRLFLAKKRPELTTGDPAEIGQGNVRACLSALLDAAFTVRLLVCVPRTLFLVRMRFQGANS